MGWTISLNLACSYKFVLVVCVCLYLCVIAGVESLTILSTGTCLYMYSMNGRTDAQRKNKHTLKANGGNLKSFYIAL